jgi:hypothetical protein
MEDGRSPLVREYTATSTAEFGRTASTNRCGLLSSQNLEVADKSAVAFLPSIPMFTSSRSAGGGFRFFRKRAALQHEILALRHQFGVLQRSVILVLFQDETNSVTLPAWQDLE